jgi:DNA-binding transcriptional MerR regulator
MELTIDQLARRVDMSARNIREWQRLGLVSPPARRGRVGIYSDEHVARIERVKKLRTDGLPLDLIRRLIETGTGSEVDIRHLANEVLDPIAATGSISIPRQEFVDRFGHEAFDALAELGLGSDRGDGDVVTVRDAATLELIEQLSQLGISTSRLTAALVEVRRHQRDIARLVINVYREDVWAPFLASGFTTRDWGSIADDVARAKPIAIALLARMLDSALDDVAGSVLLSAATEAEGALEKS